LSISQSSEAEIFIVFLLGITTVLLGIITVFIGDNSSEEEDEELVFEEVVERNLSEAEAYDSSAENERDMFPTQRNRSLKFPFLNKPSRTVMSLLRRKPRKEQEPGDLVCKLCLGLW